ncbi:thiol peroxidase [Desulfopila sp. IMCC35008]|uniref:thiol peroxidase n=1 Tax=Desulfopila sp. IMCC35008 TaxID=2653858 RepID=UPI0013D53CAB|nr:thiol peroxidase [Desulfopila sp. IMCC35008]
MATITLKGNEISTVGELPAKGSNAAAFSLVATDLSEKSLADFSGKYVVLNVFPSIDTPVCAASVRKFNEVAGKREDTVVFCISADLPFAHNRFCEVDGLKDVIPLSTFRNSDFGSDYGLTITTGPLAGLLSRAIIIVNPDGKVIYTEQVPEIAQEPDYDAALAAF